MSLCLKLGYFVKIELDLTMIKYIGVLNLYKNQKI